jgi:hypothetical protein
LTIDSRRFDPPLRNLTITQSLFSGELPRNVFNLDKFVLKQSALSRDSLNLIVPPPSRVPAVCELPKNYFYCPIPSWALACGLTASDCLQRPSLPAPVGTPRYVEDGCRLERLLQTRVVWPCSVFDCSGKNCSGLIGWPGKRFVCRRFVSERCCRLSRCREFDVVPNCVILYQFNRDATVHRNRIHASRR